MNLRQRYNVLMLLNSDLQLALIDRGELARRVKWYINLRWFFLVSLSIVGIVSDYLIANSERLRLVDTIAFSIAILANLGLFLFSKFIHRPLSLGLLALAQILFDIFVSSYVIYTHGGAQSRTIILYAIPIIMAGALFGRIAAYLAATFGALAYSATILLNASGWERAYTVSPLYISPQNELIIPIIFYVCVFFILAALGNFLSGINALTEQELAQQEAISLASHQLRTPATAVKGFLAGILEEGEGRLSDRQKDYLTKAYEENERQLQLVDTMLLVAQADSKALTPNKSRVDLAKLIDEAIAQRPPTITRASQQLTVSKKQDADYFCRVDPKLIRLVIDNLLDNASKYTPEGGSITITMTATEGKVGFSVQDTGIGISKKDFSKLFKRYSRISKVAHFNSRGSGLGLYLVKKIIDIHQGKISVQSTSGQGTIFNVMLGR